MMVIARCLDHDRRTPDRRPIWHERGVRSGKVVFAGRERNAVVHWPTEYNWRKEADR